MPPRARSPRPEGLPALTFAPLTADRWGDLEALFGPRGACAGCWCMWWKLSRPAFDAGRGEGNRAALLARVRGGEVPGLLAYEGDAPVGWVALAPRADYPRLARARTLAAVDDAPVWSLTCLFVARSHRGRGLTSALLAAAAEHARAAGAPALEAYPVDTAAKLGDAFLYTGAASTFRALGFEEVARRSRTRPVMRMALSGSRPARPARARAPGHSSPPRSRTRGSASRRGR